MKESVNIMILDKQIPFELIERYIRVLWNYKEDFERRRAHDNIFTCLNVDRYSDDGYKYFDEVDHIICHAFVCCGLSVNRDHECIGKCGTKLTMQMSLFNALEYCKSKGNIIK